MPFFVGAGGFSGAKKIGPVELGTVGPVNMYHLVFGAFSRPIRPRKRGSGRRPHRLLWDVVIGSVRKARVVISGWPLTFEMR